MAENFDQQRDFDNEGGEEVYSKVVRAGRRTYFFDVKATRGDDYFITITESRKKQGKDGAFFFDKHKIYLYKEDFSKFGEGFSEVVDFIKRTKPEFFEQEATPRINGFASGASVDDEFDSL